MNKKKKSLRLRLMLLSTLPVLATGLLLVILYVFVTYNKYMTFYGNEGVALARSYAASVDNTIASLSQQFDVVTKNASVVNELIPIDQRKGQLAEAASTSTFKDFAIAYSSGRTYNDTNISEREYFQQAMALKDAYVSSPVLRMTDNSVTIMMGKYFTQGMGEYVVYGGLDANTFSNLIKEVHFEDNGIAFIVDKAGVVVATSTSGIEQLTELLGNNTLDASIGKAVSNMLTKNEGVSGFTHNGAKYTVGYAKINSVEGWTVVVATPTKPIVDSIVKASLLVLLVAIVMAAIAVFIAKARVKRIAGPLAVTSDRLEGLANGDLSSETQVFHTGDEIETMSESMDNMVRSISACIQDIAAVLTRVSRGDLTAETSVEYPGDLKSIEESVDMILGSLNEIISGVNTSSNEVTKSAGQLAEGASSLSNGAIAQAAAVDEMTATVQSMAQKTADNEEKVQQALAITRSTDEKAHDGSRSMEEMLAAIREIEATSQKIETINKVIEDIAFQTNILALNAAVEAARAGSAGKGFAVVADEVRNLAAKSAEASQQASAMISDSIAAVEKGTGLADNTSKVLEDIVEGVDQVSGAIRGIAQFNTEQNVAVQQISSAMDDINAAIHQTTGTAEESAAESEELSGLASELRNAVAHFKLKSGR